LAVAYDQGITPVIIMTKSDLTDPAKFLETYVELDVIAFTTQRGADLTSISLQLRNKTSVLIGHSGVGKSTLVNALLGDEHRTTGDVNDATGRGRHTSSSAISFELPGGGYIIDTPGVRSFGLEHIDKSRVISSFAELQPAIALCPKNCSHDEQMCGLNDFIAGRPELQRRVAGLRRLLAASSQPIT
jgi:ribosome biogenesis GTPase